MKSYLDRGEGKALITKIAATYNFEIALQKGGPVVKVWTIDLKNGQGAIKEGKTEGVDATFLMTDDDFELVCQGKLPPQ
jgi:3-hydroxyacyl-CoA dehydrogenase/3a,7a,12a-trihydroxy-5b-cholest-24-enoyl-CoA hydratase